MAFFESKFARLVLKSILEIAWVFTKLVIISPSKDIRFLSFWSNSLFTISLFTLPFVILVKIFPSRFSISAFLIFASILINPCAKIGWSINFSKLSILAPLIVNKISSGLNSTNLILYCESLDAISVIPFTIVSLALPFIVPLVKNGPFNFWEVIFWSFDNSLIFILYSKSTTWEIKSKLPFIFIVELSLTDASKRISLIVNLKSLTFILTSFCPSFTLSSI